MFNWLYNLFKPKKIDISKERYIKRYVHKQEVPRWQTATDSDTPTTTVWDTAGYTIYNQPVISDNCSSRNSSSGYSSDSYSSSDSGDSSSGCD